MTINILLKLHIILFPPQNHNLYMRREFPFVINPVCSFLKIVLITVVNIHEFLRITVNQWEP